MCKYEKVPDGMELLVKIRHHDPGTMATVYWEGEDLIRVEFASKVNGVAPGQSAVFLEDADVVGGGIIHSSHL